MHNRFLKTSLFTCLAISMIACQSHHFVLDKAGLLDSKSAKQLEQTISAYHNKTTCAIYVYTIDKLPEGEDASSYTKSLTGDLDLNKQKSDNSAIIFIAAQDKQVILQPEYGLEWQIDAGISELIVRDLRMYFGQGLYQDGIFRAVNQIIGLTNKLSWKIIPYSTENTRTQNVIELNNFHVQQSTSDSIVVTTNNSDTITLYITKYMSDLVKNLSSANASSATIYYRPVADKQNEGYLINIAGG